MSLQRKEILPEDLNALECGGKAGPGNYRRIQNYVANAATGEVIYTPPGAADVPTMMSELVKWLNNDLDLHPVLASGIAQFQLVHIHPFLDGNGRASRLLSTRCLYKAGYDFKRLFTIGEYYDRDRPIFYKKLQSVRENDMDMTGGLNYFIPGLETQMIEVKERGEQVIRRDVLVQKHSLNERQAKALDLLMKNSSVHISKIEALCSGVTRRTLQRDMNGLIERNLVRSTGSARQYVRYVFKQIINNHQLSTGRSFVETNLGSSGYTLYSFSGCCRKRNSILNRMSVEKPGEQRMKQVEWTNDLSVGIELIDEQHRMLIKRLNDFSEAVEQHHGPNKIGATLGFLIEYTDFHFSAEERHMAASGYPDLEAHRLKHDEYKATLSALEQDFRDDGPTHELASSIDTLLVNWLLKHIRQVDSEFGAFLSGKGITLSEED